MKIVSWNINSIRARQDRLLTLLETRQPDVLCLQELKCQDEQFPAEEVSRAGYHFCCHGQKTYNGVAILARDEIHDVQRGLQDAVEDPQSRVIAATVRGVRIVCVYAPNGQAVGSEAFQYKLEWFRRLRRYLDQRHAPEERLLLCGDLNIAPEPRDVHDPALWEGRTMFTLAEREAFGQLCGFGLVDAFRRLRAEEGLFSWWDYRMLAFPKNWGLRIDHLLATSPLASLCREAGIDRDLRKGSKPSDHAPVWADFELG